MSFNSSSNILQAANSRYRGTKILDRYLDNLPPAVRAARKTRAVMDDIQPWGRPVTAFSKTCGGLGKAPSSVPAWSWQDEPRKGKFRRRVGAAEGFGTRGFRFPPSSVGRKIVRPFSPDEKRGPAPHLGQEVPHRYPDFFTQPAQATSRRRKFGEFAEDTDVEMQASQLHVPGAFPEDAEDVEFLRQGGEPGNRGIVRFARSLLTPVNAVLRYTQKLQQCFGRGDSAATGQVEAGESRVCRYAWQAAGGVKRRMLEVSAMVRQVHRTGTRGEDAEMEMGEESEEDEEMEMGEEEVDEVMTDEESESEDTVMTDEGEEDRDMELLSQPPVASFSVDLRPDNSTVPPGSIQSAPVTSESERERERGSDDMDCEPHVGIWPIRTTVPAPPPSSRLANHLIWSVKASVLAGLDNKRRIEANARSYSAILERKRSAKNAVIAAIVEKQRQAQNLADSAFVASSLAPSTARRSILRQRGAASQSPQKRASFYASPQSGGPVSDVREFQVPDSSTISDRSSEHADIDLGDASEHDEDSSDDSDDSSTLSSTSSTSTPSFDSEDEMAIDRVAATGTVWEEPGNAHGNEEEAPPPPDVDIDDSELRAAELDAQTADACPLPPDPETSVLESEKSVLSSSPSAPSDDSGYDLFDYRSRVRFDVDNESVLSADEPDRTVTQPAQVQTPTTPGTAANLQQSASANVTAHDATSRSVSSDGNLAHEEEIISPVSIVSQRRSSERIRRTEEEALQKLLDLQIDRDIKQDEKRRIEEHAKEAVLRVQKAAEEEERRRLIELEKERRGHRITPSQAVIAPLSPDWEEQLAQAMASPEGRELATSSTGTKILRRDFGTLLPQRNSNDRDSGWLNDEIIAASMQHVVDYALEQVAHRRGTTPKYHAFNSFFYKNLREKGAESIKRWATRAKLGGQNLLNVDYVFIPVNENGHWTLMIVMPTRKTVEYFDSFHGNPSRFLENARQWIKAELGRSYNEEEWTYQAGIGPTQYNGKDCGVFTVTTAKMIMLGLDPEQAYGHQDMALQRKRIACELMNGGLSGEFTPVESGYPGVVKADSRPNSNI